MPRTPPPIARLAPLMPQLALALQLGHDDIPEVLRAAGKMGERHIAILVSLAVSGPGAVSQLAERIGISQPHASLVVGDLARADLVNREHDPSDRRLIIVSLSLTAAPAIAELGRRRSGALLTFLDELAPSEADAFIDQLARLIEILRTGS
jgi:DNA-binding MarR family transcriptional regulator